MTSENDQKITITQKMKNWKNMKLYFSFYSADSGYIFIINHLQVRGLKRNISIVFLNILIAVRPRIKEIHHVNIYTCTQTESSSCNQNNTSKIVTIIPANWHTSTGISKNDTPKQSLFLPNSCRSESIYCDYLQCNVCRFHDMTFFLCV